LIARDHAAEEERRYREVQQGKILGGEQRREDREKRRNFGEGEDFNIFGIYLIATCVSHIIGLSIIDYSSYKCCIKINFYY